MTEDIGTVRWFGESWGAPICDPRAHIPTPVDWACAGHDHLHDRAHPGMIRAGDQGVTIPSWPGPPTVIAYHLRCWLHEIGADRLMPGKVRDVGAPGWTALDLD